MKRIVPDKPDRILAILAGGGATRFSGVEKIRLKLGGKTILERIISSLAEPEFFDKIDLLIGQKDERTFQPLPVTSTEIVFIKDKFPGKGPLGGLLSVFEANKDSQVFLCAGDMPFPSRDLMKELYRGLSKDHLISIAESRRGVEPLFGWYSSDLYEITLKSVKKGNVRMISIYRKDTTRVLPISKVEKICDPDICFFNINTEKDYQRGEEIALRGLNENISI